MTDADLASIYTINQLNFLWNDPARPPVQEFIGVTCARIDDVRKPRNTDGFNLMLNITGYITGTSGSRLLLPADHETGESSEVEYQPHQTDGHDVRFA